MSSSKCETFMGCVFINCFFPFCLIGAKIANATQWSRQIYPHHCCEFELHHKTWQSGKIIQIIFHNSNSRSLNLVNKKLGNIWLQLISKGFMRPFNLYPDNWFGGCHLRFLYGATWEFFLRKKAATLKKIWVEAIP